MRADHVLGAAPLDEPAAHFAVRSLHRLGHLHQRDAVRGELVRIDGDLVLPHEPADAGHFGDAGDRLQLITDVPVFQRTQVGQRTLAGGVDERVLVYPADPRRVGAELGLHAFGQTPLDFRQVLEHTATRPVHVSAILEDDVNVGVAEIREAANGLHSRRA